MCPVTADARGACTCPPRLRPRDAARARLRPAWPSAGARRQGRALAGAVVDLAVVGRREAGGRGRRDGRAGLLGPRDDLRRVPSTGAALSASEPTARSAAPAREPAAGEPARTGDAPTCAGDAATCAGDATTRARESAPNPGDTATCAREPSAREGTTTAGGAAAAREPTAGEHEPHLAGVDLGREAAGVVAGSVPRNPPRAIDREPLSRSRPDAPMALDVTRSQRSAAGCALAE